MNLRQAESSDAPVIADFNLRLAHETEHLRLDLARVHAGVAAVLGDPAKGIYFVAEIDRVIAGQLMITYEWSDWRNGVIWWLQSVYVRPDFRGRGVFRALFDHLKQLARARPNVCGLRLYMRAGNARARHAYERLGMKQTKYKVFEMELEPGNRDFKIGAKPSRGRSTQRRNNSLYT